MAVQKNRASQIIENLRVTGRLELDNPLTEAVTAPALPGEKPTAKELGTLFTDLVGALIRAGILVEGEPVTEEPTIGASLNMGKGKEDAPDVAEATPEAPTEAPAATGDTTAPAAPQTGTEATAATETATQPATPATTGE